MLIIDWTTTVGSALVVLLIFVVAASTIVPMMVARQRRAAVQLAAAEPVLIDGSSYDAAEVLWAFRQLNESPHLSALSGEDLTTSAEIVTAVNRTMTALPPDHAAEVLQAQLRLKRTSQFRTELLRAPSAGQTLIPALGDAAVIALAAHDPSPLSDLGGLLLAHKAESMMQLGHVPFFEDAVDAAVGSAAEQGAHLVGHLLDAHVPIVSIVMAIAAAKKSAEAGLDPNRVTENLMWDLGAKGGSIMAGAGIGTLVLPGIGTVIGGLAGAIGGSFAAHQGKRRHLRSAIVEFRTSCEMLGADISEGQLATIARDSNTTIEMKTTRLIELDAELAAVEAHRSWFQRAFRPTVGLTVASRAIELGNADIQVDQYQHEALTALFSASSDSPEFRGYVWVASHTHLDWLDHDGPEPNDGLETLEKVRTETTNLRMAGH